MAQDDSREKAVISAFDLSPYKGDLESRDARYVPDAYIVVDGERVTIELKSKPQKRTVTRKDKTTYEAPKSDVSTARGFGEKKVNDWKRETNMFLFSEYEGLKFNSEEPNFTEHYAITFDDLMPHIEEKVLKPYREGRAPRWNSDGYIGLDRYYDVIRPLLAEKSELSEQELKSLDQTIKVGASLNDPKFRWAYIKEHGTLISSRKDLEDFWRKTKKK
jgi:hypothetical protein